MCPLCIRNNIACTRMYSLLNFILALVTLRYIQKFSIHSFIISNYLPLLFDVKDFQIGFEMFTGPSKTDHEDLFILEGTNFHRIKTNHNFIFLIYMVFLKSALKAF